MEGWIANSGIGYLYNKKRGSPRVSLDWWADISVNPEVEIQIMEGWIPDSGIGDLNDETNAVPHVLQEAISRVPREDNSNQ